MALGSDLIRAVPAERSHSALACPVACTCRFSRRAPDIWSEFESFWQRLRADPALQGFKATRSGVSACGQSSMQPEAESSSQGKSAEEEIKMEAGHPPEQGPPQAKPSTGELRDLRGTPTTAP